MLYGAARARYCTDYFQLRQAGPSLDQVGYRAKVLGQRRLLRSSGEEVTLLVAVAHNVELAVSNKRCEMNANCLHR
jgi:hypothetical protein